MEWMFKSGDIWDKLLSLEDRGIENDVLIEEGGIQVFRQGSQSLSKKKLK